MIEHNPEHVLTLWHGIKRAAELPLPKPDRRSPARFAELVRKQGAHHVGVSDYLIGIGVPWDAADHWRHLAALAGIQVQALHARPKSGAASTWCAEGLTLPDLAYLAIMLERWAIPIDPAPLVAAVAPTLKGKGLLTDAELAVCWHARERGRMGLIRIDAPMPSDERGTVETRKGYRAACWSRGLVIASPRIGKRTWSDELNVHACFDRRSAA